MWFNRSAGVNFSVEDEAATYMVASLAACSNDDSQLYKRLVHPP